jgi:hypothetical protein
MRTMTKTRMMKTKTRSGIRPLPILAILLLCLAGVAGGEKQKAYAVVAGTVFHEPGFVLPGAEVVLRATVLPPGVKRLKTLTARSDGRGEFAFHVPAGKSEYLLSVKAEGYLGEEKPVKVESEERVDTYFTLRAVK